MVIHTRHSRWLGSEIDGIVYSNFFVILVSRLRNYRDVVRYCCSMCGWLHSLKPSEHVEEVASFNVECNPSKRYVEELRKTKKQLPIVVELLAKMSWQLLDPNPIAVCIEHLVTFESLVITRTLLTNSILYAMLGAPIPVALRFKAWDCGFECRRGHGYLPFVSVLCYQVQVSATGRFLVQRSPTDCGVSLSVVKCSSNLPQPQWLGRRCKYYKRCLYRIYPRLIYNWQMV